MDAGAVKRQPPYYESRFVRANHPYRGQALWLRSTLLLPTSGVPVADSWVMVFDPDGSGNRALKVPHSIDQCDFRDDTWSARIGATSIDDGTVRGAVGASGRSAHWDLRITPGGQAPVKLLTERGYKARFPTAKTMVRHPLARFDGDVELDDVRLQVDGWTGSVNHNWGRRHTPAYAFGQVCGFDGSPSSSLEVVTARAAVGPVLLPAATLLVLRHDGREVAVRSVPASRHTHGDYRPFHWTFGARVDDVTVDGEITAEPHDVIGLTYTDTGGESKYCYNSALASCRIRLSGSGIAATELTASRRAMFEILTGTRHETVSLLA
ncbi:hypothetical protein DVS77_12880 [Mycolicibacterium moriokaense]|nr:hypothetical protein DVS77_12880 [Mycolicibacterium moriokaense]